MAPLPRVAVSVTLSPWILFQLAEVTEAAGVSRSAYIESALVAAIGKETQP